MTRPVGLDVRRSMLFTSRCLVWLRYLTSKSFLMKSPDLPKDGCQLAACGGGENFPRRKARRHPAPAQMLSLHENVPPLPACRSCPTVPRHAQPRKGRTPPSLRELGFFLREGGDFETASEAVNIRSGAEKDSKVELKTVASVYIEPQSGREGRFAAERVGSKPPPDCDHEQISATTNQRSPKL